MTRGTAHYNALSTLLSRRALWLCIVGAAILTVVSTADLVVAFHQTAEKRYMERYVLSPLPASMSHVKTLYLFEPTLGDGACWVAYEMRPEDFNEILHKGKLPWQKDMSAFEDQVKEREKQFRKVWPDQNGKLENYTLGANSQEGIPGTVEMVVSPDHSRAVFFIGDL